MSKPTPTDLPPGIHHINPLHIELAPELAAIPMMLDVAGFYLKSKNAAAKSAGAEMDEELTALFFSLERDGIQEPVKGTPLPDGGVKLWDGRHRLSWAVHKNLPTVPVIYVTEQQGRELMESTVIGRRHWTKGQRAWLTVKLHPEVCESGAHRPKKNSDSIGLTATDLAKRVGVSPDTIHQAVELYRKLYAPGAKAGSAEAIEAAALRERYEMSIWGGAGLGAVIAGIGGGEKTNGKRRPASGFHTLDKPLGALTRQAAAYEKWDGDERAKANELLRTRVAGLPESFRLALQEALAASALV